MKRISIILAAAFLMTGNALDAKVTLPSVISDNMVLQQQTDAALWGTADPGRKVTITTTWSKQKTVVTADGQTGKWLARVATPSAGGPYEITISDGKDPVTLTNVLIGEVWFASGQSNMEMPVKGYGSQPARDGAKYIVSAKPSRPIRICNIARCSSTKPLSESKGSWKVHDSKAVADISATAYFFAETLQSCIDVPVGILVTSWGGSTIETWIKQEVIEKDFPEFDLGHLKGTREPRNKNHEPSLLYNGQVAPVVPYTIKGMIWYQGEANRGREEQYIRLQKAYVEMMRDIFSVPDAPFYFVQIAPYPYSHPTWFDSGYFYECQQKSLEVIPHSGMAVTCDVGQYGTIHPCRKQEVGQRLAYLALKHDYGQTAIEADAPTYKSVKFEEGQAYVKFNVDGLGLSPMGANIIGFEIAGEDKVFHTAEAKLYGKDHSVIIVSSAEVPEPVAVRYCFRNWCEGGLYNNFGIPAAPFRTDDWQIKE